MHAANQTTRYTTINWLRAFYLANLLIMLVFLLVYLFNVRIPAIPNFYVNDTNALLITYVVLFGIIILLEWINVIERNRFVSSLFQNKGMRWYDLFLAIFAGLIILLAWRFEKLEPFIWIPCGLVIVNCVLTNINRFSQVLHSVRRRENIEEMPAPGESTLESTLRAQGGGTTDSEIPADPDQNQTF